MSVVEHYHFDEPQFERLRALVADGTLSEESNYVRGAIEPLPRAALVPLDRALVQKGREAIDRGEVAAAVLNGGMATRFGGVVKGIVEAVDGRSFLEWKLLDAERAGVPMVVMNSFATDEATREFVSALKVTPPLFFTQSVSLRLNRDGSLFADDE